MKKVNFSSAALALLVCALASVAPLLAWGQQTLTSPGAPASPGTPSRLPYGVEDILKLSRAQVGDEIIINYIRNSGTIYNLSANDIVYLRYEGVSDHVINTMLDQRKALTDPAQPQTQTPAPAQSIVAPAPQNQANAQPQQPAPTYVEAPTQAPASSTYVIPYAPNYPAYYPYPYYYNYPYSYYWGGPVISFGFYGGHYGGYYHGHYGGHGYYGGHGGYHH